MTITKPNGAKKSFRGYKGMRAPMKGFEAKSIHAPYKRLAAGVITNALLEYKSICAKYKLATKDQKRTDRIRLQSIEQELCEDKNIFVNLLEVNGHAMDSPKIRRILLNFKKQFKIP